MPLLQNVLHFMAQRLPLDILLLSMVKLSSKFVEMRDDTHIRYFIRMYSKVLNAIESTTQQWSPDKFEVIYNGLCDYINEFPKGDPIYTSRSRLDILRCHVTLCNKFTQRYPTIAQSVLDRNPTHKNQIYGRIQKELESIDISGEKVGFLILNKILFCENLNSLIIYLGKWNSRSTSSWSYSFITRRWWPIKNVQSRSTTLWVYQAQSGLWHQSVIERAPV